MYVCVCVCVCVCVYVCVNIYIIYVRIRVLTARLTSPVSDDGERGREAGGQCGFQRVDCSGGI